MHLLRNSSIGIAGGSRSRDYLMGMIGHTPGGVDELDMTKKSIGHVHPDVSEQGMGR